MVQVRAAWYEDLRHGAVYYKTQWCGSLMKLFARLVALQTTIIALFVLAGAYSIKYGKVDSMRETLKGQYAAENYFNIWSYMKALERLNLDKCLDVILTSCTTGCGFIIASSATCMIVGTRCFRKADLLCLLMLFLSFLVVSREMKHFDNIKTEAQEETMNRTTTALIRQIYSLDRDVVRTLDQIMSHGNCCGIVSSYDMKNIKKFLYGIKSRKQGSHHDFGPLYSKCWQFNRDEIENNELGCYVVYFEKLIKPFVRCGYGLAMIAQVIMFLLIAVEGEIYASKDETTMIVFCERKPTPFPDD